jgi:hypothetical protein
MAPGSTHYNMPEYNAGSPWPYTYTGNTVTAWGLTGTLSGGAISWNNGFTYYCNGLCGAADVPELEEYTAAAFLVLALTIGWRVRRIHYSPA